ncbi:MAG: T9SS type A sorting domain-containing protein, partial [Saprospiraceae bacterium]
SFCPGESVTIAGQTYTQPGTVIANLASTTGACDTIVTYTLELLPQPTLAETRSFCTGEFVTIAGQTYTQPGTVIANLASTTGECDTIATYTLELRPQPTLAETRRFCPGESVTIAGQTYTQPGTVIANLASTTGACDTIATYTLELRPQPTLAETRSFCPGESITIAGQTYTQPGTVIANLASTTGECDTIATYTLELRPQPVLAETRSFCPGESVIIAGKVYTEPGTVIANLNSTTGGCDTLATYTLKYLTPAASNIAIHCPNNQTIYTPSGAGSILATYLEPMAASDCICPGLDLSRSNGPASGSLFPIGNTQVCYSAKDNCGQEKPCCFSVNVREEAPCDVKVNGCMKYELLSVSTDPGQNYTYKIRVTNSCSNKLVYTAIQVPDGLTTTAPANNSVYTTKEGRSYLVSSPNYSPMYSIRFKAIADSIANGQSDIFEYTLPAQAEVSYINITSRLSNQGSYEAHLNTFKCPVGITPSNEDVSNRYDESGPAQNNVLLLFPNPTTGVFYVGLSNWKDQKLNVQITNTQGQLVHSNQFMAVEDLYRVEMPRDLTSGVYFFEISNEKSEKELVRFMLQR